MGGPRNAEEAASTSTTSFKLHHNEFSKNNHFSNSNHRYPILNPDPKPYTFKPDCQNFFSTGDASAGATGRYAEEAASASLKLHHNELSNNSQRYPYERKLA